MNAKAAKHIPLLEILHRLGLEPVKEIRGEMWYASPLREENEPSFKINLEKNVWFDFGHGEGGNALDFIMTYYEVDDVSKALKQLEQLIGSPSESIHTSRYRAGPSAEAYHALPPAIERLQSLQHPALIR